MTVEVAPKRPLVSSALFVVALFACGDADAPSIGPDVSSPDASTAPEGDAGELVAKTCADR